MKLNDLEILRELSDQELVAVSGGAIFNQQGSTIIKLQLPLQSNYTFGKSTLLASPEQKFNVITISIKRGSSSK
jgi:hypothetical protein